MNTYTSLEARLHDAFWAEEESPELGWLDALLLARPGSAIEIGCGSGRLLLPLLRKGHDVEGLEPSADMLELCRLHPDGLSPVLHQGDMADFNPGKTYHAVLVPAFTLQLAADPPAALANFHRLLEPGGILYLTVFIPWAEIHGELPQEEWYPDHATHLTDGRRATVHTRHRIDKKARILHREHHYRLHDGERITEHRSEQTVRWFTAHQLRKLLDRSGFIPESAVADFDESLPVTEDSQILTLIARKLP